MPAPILSTWLYAEPEGEESFYPQVAGRPSSPWFQAIYWRCVAVFYAAAARTAPGARLVFYTNVPEIPDVEGAPVGALLERLGVEIERPPFTFVPPDGYYGAWRNQFYVLDLIGALADRLGPDDVGVLLDSDCVWVGAPDALAAATRAHGALTLDVGIAMDEKQNGLTPREMGRIYAELGAPAEVPVYYGGEIVAATGTVARRLADEARAVWDEMLRRHTDGLPKFNEEAHLLSFLYHRMGLARGTADAFTDRIYTSLKDGKTVRPGHFALPLWHLPNEKRYGFRRLFPAVMDGTSWFWQGPPDEAWRARLGRVLGVPRRTPRKAVLDVAAAVRDKAASWSGLRD